jgi:hypothetical protein
MAPIFARSEIVGGGVPSTARMHGGGAGMAADGAGAAVAGAPIDKHGATLASAQPGRPVTDPPPKVMVVAPVPASETLPSKDLPVIGRGPGRGGGVAPALVVVLVTGALVAGFLLGWSVGHVQ